MFDANEFLGDRSGDGRTHANESIHALVHGHSGAALPDVVQAVEWLCGTFGFTEHLRIGSHRSQLTVGDGSVVVAAGPLGSGIDSKKTGEGRRSHQGEMNHSVMVRVPNVDRHFEGAKQRGAK